MRRRLQAAGLVASLAMTIVPMTASADGHLDIIEDLATVVAVADSADSDFPAGSLMRAECDYLVRIEDEDGASQEWSSCTLSDEPVMIPENQGSVPTSVHVDAGGECIWTSDYWWTREDRPVFASEFEVVVLPSGRVHTWASYPAEPLECETEE